MTITRKDIDDVVEIYTDLLDRIEELESRPPADSEHGWYDIVREDGEKQLIAWWYGRWVVPFDLDGPLISTTHAVEFDGVVKRWKKR